MPDAPNIQQLSLSAPDALQVGQAGAFQRHSRMVEDLGAAEAPGSRHEIQNLEQLWLGVPVAACRAIYCYGHSMS